MANLKEFLTRSAEQAPAAPEKLGSPFPALQRQELMQAMNRGIGLSMGALIQADQAGAFAAQVSELATSDAVMDELSDQLGTPRAGETEDAFVARAQATMARILSGKLSDR